MSKSKQILLGTVMMVSLLVYIFVVSNAYAFDDECYEASGFGETAFNGDVFVRGSDNGWDAQWINGGGYCLSTGNTGNWYLQEPGDGCTGADTIYYYSTTGGHTTADLATYDFAIGPPAGSIDIVSCDGPTPPSATSTTATSTALVYDPIQNVFYGFFLFGFFMMFGIWLFARKR